MTGSPRGVLFDMDGVLVATEALKCEAHEGTVRSLGGQVTRELYRTVMGRAQDEVVRAYIEAVGLDVAVTTYSQRFRSAYLELLRARLELVPGARELLDALRSDRLRLALVSSSPRWMMDDVLARTGLAGFFEGTVSADDVEREKPAPDPYLRALSALALRPDAALVIEDTEAGIAAARAARLPVIAVRHEYNRRHDLSGAAAELDGLSDVGRVVRLVRSLLAAQGSAG